MSVPKPVGNVHFSEARAVMVRDPEDHNAHSAVHGTINVYVDTLTDSKLVIDNWARLMTLLSDEVVKILAAAPKP